MSFVKASRPLFKKPFFLALLGILVIVLLVAILELTNTTHLFHKETGVSNVSSAGQGNEKGESAKGGATDSQSQNVPTGDNKSTANTSATLLTPTGNFVSNHHPNLSGQPAPNQMQSDCTTTAGATCQIIFTNGATVKTLPAQTTDRGGTTYWTWKLQDIGLSEGSWKIQAKATLGNQTLTADDALALEVSP